MKNTLGLIEKRLARLIAPPSALTSDHPTSRLKVDLVRVDPEILDRLTQMQRD